MAVTGSASVGGIIGKRGGKTMAMRGGRKKKKKTTRGGRRRK